MPGMGKAQLSHFPILPKEERKALSPPMSFYPNRSSGLTLVPSSVLALAQAVTSLASSACSSARRMLHPLAKCLGAGRGVPGRAMHCRVSMSLRKPCPQARRRETGKKRAKFVRGAVGTGSRELLTPQHPEIPTSGCLQQPEPDLCWSRWSGRRVP